MLPRWRCVLLGFAVSPYLLLAAAGQKAKPTFAQDVQPVLKAHCASCHSGSEASAGLDLTTVSGIKRVVKANDSKHSPLILRLSGIGGTQMPMGFAPLPKETIDRIAEWIDAGAVIDGGNGKHWAYIPPVKPSVPKLTSPRIRNPIDAFVLANLRKQGLTFSPEASKETLLRRVYLDLIGLPPSPKEIDAFLADKRPDAYERVVDALMKNPHYGERQAEPWLDLSRYADSDGYEKDLNRTAWEYRDWLIDAFNKNLPYNQFTIDQLAGDMLPNPTQEDLIATGFNRNTMMNREGGVDQEEAHFNVILDRVNTTSTVWLGSTLQCARCHNHKYDPFTQVDYYRMAAFFANAAIYPEGSKAVGEEKWLEASIQTPSPQQEAERRRLKTEIAEIERRMAIWTPELQSAYARWFEGAKRGAAWLVLNPKELKSENGATLKSDEFGVISSTGTLPATDIYTVTGPAGLKRITGFSIEAMADPSLPAKGPGRADNGNFVISKVSLVAGTTKTVIASAKADFDQRDFDASKVNGPDVNFGWAVSEGQGKSHEIVFDLKEPVEVNPDTPVRVEIDQLWPGGKHLLGKFRVSLTSTDHPASLLVPGKIRQLLDVATPGDAADKALKDYYLKVAPALDEDRDRLSSLNRDLATLEAAIPTALVMRDRPCNGPLTAYVHSRGQFLTDTELVTAGFPAALSAPEPDAEPVKSVPEPHDTKDPAPVPHINANGSITSGPVRTRLDLAKWLVSRSNPLTARVEVNRLWEQCFGRGIVETSEDFGTQGARPTNQPLLDWLACEFMDKGWDMKGIVRLIVTSSTYRQSSDATAALIERDPQNALLARGPRFRLDAETIRDNALSAAGLLDPKIGGPSVFPYQPDGVWDNPFSSERWPESPGGDRYRRGLYTFIKRSAPYPSLLSFDGTSREECTVRRIRTDTPLQALALLNDKAIFDAAEALGKRMAAEGGKTVEQQVAYGFRLCTGRRPSKVETTNLAALLGKLKKRFAANPAGAKKLGGTPSQAAWTMVGNVLLNLDETVTKG
ncbi:MAG TPA: DUF1553 domain-containing protein [Fimbriimonadaceae bacterium]|nr:DUF1553 domain-containing protein [Fimbriimonadaceae bacterium]